MSAVPGSDSEVDDLRKQVAELERELVEARRLIAHVIQAEDHARRRIAQLIHDDALQSLLAAHQELIEAAPGRAQVMRAHEVVGGTIERLREATMALHPVTLEQGGFEQALGAVARQAARQGGFEVEISIDPEALGVADEPMLAAARELLNNVARHAGASNVSVAIRRDGDAVELEVADDGIGLEPGRREAALADGHIGLASLTQRLNFVGGEFRVETSGEGTTALARVPLDGDAADANGAAQGS